jgi:hypothetical protein
VNCDSCPLLAPHQLDYIKMVEEIQAILRNNCGFFPWRFGQWEPSFPNSMRVVGDHHCELVKIWFGLSRLIAPTWLLRHKWEMQVDIPSNCVK